MKALCFRYTKQLGHEVIVHHCRVSTIKEGETICKMLLFSRADVPCKPFYSFVTARLKAHSCSSGNSHAMRALILLLCWRSHGIFRRVPSQVKFFLSIQFSFPDFASLSKAQIWFVSVLELTRSASPQRQLHYSKGLLYSYENHQNKKWVNVKYLWTCITALKIN